VCTLASGETQRRTLSLAAVVAVPAGDRDRRAVASATPAPSQPPASLVPAALASPATGPWLHASALSVTINAMNPPYAAHPSPRSALVGTVTNSQPPDASRARRCTLIQRRRPHFTTRPRRNGLLPVHRRGPTAVYRPGTLPAHHRPGTRRTASGPPRSRRGPGIISFGLYPVDLAQLQDLSATCSPPSIRCSRFLGPSSRAAEAWRAR